MQHILSIMQTHIDVFMADISMETPKQLVSVKTLHDARNIWMTFEKNDKR